MKRVGVISMSSLVLLVAAGFGCEEEFESEEPDEIGEVDTDSGDVDGSDDESRQPDDDSGDPQDTEKDDETVSDEPADTVIGSEDETDSEDSESQDDFEPDSETIEPETDSEPEGGQLCDPCTTSQDCTGGECLVNSRTNESFCGLDCVDGQCPQGFDCLEIDSGIPPQCVPDAQTCEDSSTEDGGGSDTGQDPDSDTGAKQYEEELQYCVDLINEYRAKKGKPPLARSSKLEKCAAEGAEYDSTAGTAHAHFEATAGCGGIGDAENETPGWPLDWYGSVKNIIKESTKMMWDEGPGGGHYENIIGKHTKVGCGIYITPGKEVWVVQDFK